MIPKKEQKLKHFQTQRKKKKNANSKVTVINFPFISFESEKNSFKKRVPLSEGRPLRHIAGVLKVSNMIRYIFSVAFGFSGSSVNKIKRTSGQHVIRSRKYNARFLQSCPNWSKEKQIHFRKRNLKKFTLYNVSFFFLRIGKSR